jgi:zinc protease
MRLTTLHQQAALILAFLFSTASFSTSSFSTSCVLADENAAAGNNESPENTKNTPMEKTTSKKITEVEGISQYELSNGVEVLLFPDPSKEVVTVNMTVFVGSRHEGYGEAGMAHLLEHMLFKGTPKHPNIPKELKDRGARMNGTTWMDRTNYYETLPASDDNLKYALDLESDRLVNSFIKGEDLESEMTVVRNEFESGENDPIRILMQRVQSAAYDWHNYGKSTIGNRSDIERVPVVNLRNFYRKYYRADNVLLVIAGKFETEKALQYAEETFGKLSVPNTPIDPTYTTEPAQDGERTIVLRRVGQTQYAATAYHIPAGSHPDYAAAKALVYIYGDEPSGRLYKEMVEKETATNVYTMAYAFAEPGLFMSIAEVASYKSIETARSTLVDLMEKTLVDTPVTQKELDRAVQQILKARELEASDTDQLAVALSDWAAQGDWRLYFLYRDNIESLTIEKIQQVVKKYFVRNNRTVGLFLPSETSERIAIPESPDITSLVKDYKGREAIAAGESFDPTPSVIESKTVRGDLVGGIKYALLPKKSRGGTVSMQMTLRFGTGDSMKGKIGAIEMMGILMNRGTKRLDFTEIQDELTRLRAELSISSTVGVLQIGVKTKEENIDAVMDLIREILQEPRLDASELEVLKRQIVTGLKQSTTDPQAVAPKSVERTLAPYPKDHVLYVPTFDEEISMYQSVTVDQIREVYGSMLGNQAGEFVAVGNFDQEKLLAKVNSALSGLKSDLPYQRVNRPAQTNVAGKLDVIQTDDKANAFYYTVQQYELDESDPQYASLVLGNYILGAGALSSRLGDRVRQQEGLSYGVRSGVSARPKDKRVDFVMYAITNPNNKDRLIEVIREEVDKLRDKGITAEELSDAKEAYLQSARLGRTGDGALAGALLGQLFTGRTMMSVAQLETQISKATVESVNAAVLKYIQPDRLVAAVGGDFTKDAADASSPEAKEPVAAP